MIISESLSILGLLVMFSPIILMGVYIIIEKLL